MLQGKLHAAGPVAVYYKVLIGRVVKREFRALLAPDLGRFVLTFSFLALVLGECNGGVRKKKRA
jgi:hypothetical protein